MKYILAFSSAVLMVLLTSGCDPYWQIDYVIDNKTATDVLVETIRFEGDSSRFDVVSANSSLVLASIDGLGQRTEEVLEGWDGISFSFLNLSIGDTIQFRGDETDFARWEKVNPPRGDEIGQLRMNLTQDDF